MGSLFTKSSLFYLESKGSIRAPKDVAKMVRNKCDLGVLRTSRTKPVLHARTRFFTFWELILEPVGAPFLENRVSRNICHKGFVINTNLIENGLDLLPRNTQN